jgi:hypothetical protein
MLALPASAADPPGLINYQGVLRNADDVPLDGTYDMIFRFYDDADPAAPENEIFVDEHLASGTGAVTVTGGLFDVLLGSGNFYDGTGPGDHPHIFYVFGLHENVFLEVQVGAERLQPRMQVVSAPYAIHAVLLGGYPPSDFINTTSQEQEKTGVLRALGGIDFGDGADDDLTAAEVTGLTGGPATYADFLHQHAYADNADTLDGKHASEFIDTSSSYQTKTGMLTLDSSSQTSSTALQAFGGMVGGVFSNTEFSGWAQLGIVDTGIVAGGESAGGTFSNEIHPSSHATLADASYGIEANGPAAGGYFTTDAGSGYAYVGYLDEGISAHGDVQGGYFEDNDLTSNAHIAYGARGVEAYGQEYGVYAEGESAGAMFKNSGVVSSLAEIATADIGINARGAVAGGVFADISATRAAQVAFYEAGTGLTYGIRAEAEDIGGGFRNMLGSGKADLAVGDVGVEASGERAGGWFKDPSGTLETFVGYTDAFGETSGVLATGGDFGVFGSGDSAGGYFTLPDYSATALLGYIGDLDLRYGIHASGSSAGGYFEDTEGTAHAYLGYGDYGVWAEGVGSAGYFALNQDGVHARVHLAYDELSTGREYGLTAYAPSAAGRFHRDGGDARAELAFLDFDGSEYGVWAAGATAGGYFRDSDSSNTGLAYVASGDRGIWAAGDFAGGTFSDTIPHTNVFADVARTVVIDPGPPAIEEYYKIRGNGTNAFVQNHPEAPDKVVVYASPEGDEVATYTRGTARLLAGEARISLGSTFRWVTNPDLGLTASLTPHGDCLGLYVDSLTSDELVVRELGGGLSDVRFDYLVMGLRIGFEQAAVVQAKDREAPIPSADLGAEYYTRPVDPGVHTSLQRFRQMEADVRGVAIDEIDLSGAVALREAITASAWQRIGMGPEDGRSVADGRLSDPGHRDEDAGVGGQEASGDETKLISPGFVAQGSSEALPEGALASQNEKPVFPVSGHVDVGDLLALDPENPDVLRRAEVAADPNVIGIVVGEPSTTGDGDQALLTLYGLAVVNADASHGAILPGDLLISSPTPGHAMRATVAVPGTIVGKALEALDTGTSQIRVLVMPR